MYRYGQTTCVEIALDLLESLPPESRCSIEATWHDIGDFPDLGDRYCVTVIRRQGKVRLRAAQEKFVWASLTLNCLARGMLSSRSRWLASEPMVSIDIGKNFEEASITLDKMTLIGHRNGDIPESFKQYWNTVVYYSLDVTRGVMQDMGEKFIDSTVTANIQ